MTPEDVLRQAFEAQADRVEFAPDALGSIRTRVGRRTHQRRFLTMSLASLATAAAATATAVVVGLASCVPPDTDTAPLQPGAPSGPVVPTSPSVPPHSGVIARLPIYYIGVDRGRPVLFREFHSQTLSEESLTTRMVEAVGIMLDGDALDPNYASSWPASASVRSVELDGKVAVVDLAGAAVNGADPATARAAVQQLVWTVTAVAADRGTQLDGVRLLLDGKPVTTLWGNVNVSGTLTRASAIETLAQLWLISPQEGDTVPGTFDVHLDGAVWEATAVLRIRNAAGAVVDEKTVTLDIGAPSRGEAFVTVTLAPGRYTIEAFSRSAKDGSIVGLDNHAITVS